MLGISTFATLSTYNQLNKNMKAHKDSFERLSSGSRLNSAADDAAGMAISQKMESQTRALEQDARNIQDGVSLLATADDAVDSLQSNTQRMRELFLQAANDTQAAEDREAIRNELKELETQMSEVVRETEFNKVPLIDGTFSKKTEDASNELEPELSVPEDGSAISQKMELRDFEVDFKFRDISDSESNKLKIEIWHEDQLMGESILEDDPLKWEESAGGSEIDIGSDIVATKDGGFIAVGTTSSHNGDTQGSDAEDSIFAVKFNGNIDETTEERIEWAQTFQDSGVKAEGLSISDLPNEDGYLISGTTATDKGDSDMLLLKIDDSGDVSFKESYGGQDDFAKSIDNIEGGGQIVAGEVDARHGSQDIFLLNTDQDGNFKWETQIENPNSNDSVYDVKAVADGYLVGGSSGGEAVLHKLDSNGDLEDTIELGYNGDLRDIEVLNNGNIVTVGNGINRLELRKIIPGSGIQSVQTLSDLSSFKDGMGVEIVDNGGSEEIIISGTSIAADGSDQISAVKLGSDLNTIWESYNKDAGSHGNKGEEIYASTDGGYLSTAGELDKRLVQFDSHGIYQGEIDLSEYDGGKYAEYEISQLISGSESYHAVLENSTGEMQLAEINYSGGKFDESNLSMTNIGAAIDGQAGVALDSQTFKDLHLLEQGDSGFVIETSEGENTLLHHFDADNNLKSSFEAADEFETINNLTLNSSGNLSLVGSTERGDVEVGFTGVSDTAQIYEDLKLNFVTGTEEGISFDHETKKLEISLAESKDYNIADIKNLIAHNTKNEDVVSYYNAADFNDLLTESNDYTSDPTFNDPAKEYLDFEIDGAAGKLNTFDLSGESLILNSNSGETASAELVVDGTTLRVTANTAFRDGDKISLSDDANGIDETISFAADEADWSVDPFSDDNVMKQTEAVKEIINNKLSGHSAVNSDNQITITENAGSATGNDLEITTTDSPYLNFTVDQESVEEELGEYSFTVNSNFEDGDTLNIDGEEFTFSTSPNDGEIEIVEADTEVSESDAVKETLTNLKTKLESIDHWETVTVAGSQINFKEAAGQATGSAPTLGLSTSTDSNADISNLTVENESVAEVQGEYTLTIGNNQAFNGKEIEFNSEPGFKPGDEKAKINADDKLTFNLAEDPDFEKFELSSDVAFETTGAKWAAGPKLTVNAANNYSDSDFYRNSLENLWLKEFDDTGNYTERTYGGSGVDTGLAIEELDSGGYIMTGTSSSQDGQLSEIVGLDGSSKNWVTVLDQDLNIVDQEVETAEDPAQLTEIRKDGTAYSLFGKEADDTPVIYKLSESSGSWELTLENRFDSLNLENELSIAENNGEFLLTGNDSEGDLHNIFSSGQTTDLSTKDSSAAAITTLADGSTIIAANKDLLTGSGGSERNATVKKIDADGELIWENQLDALAGIDGMQVQDIQHTDDDNFILTGMRNGEMAVYELNKNGDTNWSKTYEGLSSLSIDQADDGNYLITGHRDLENAEELYQSNAKESNEIIADMTVLKVDSSSQGDLIWRRDYGADNETAGNAFPTLDGGAISIGTVSSYNQDKTDLNGNYTADKDTVIMKTDSSGSWEWDLNLGETDLDEQGIYDQGLHIEESYDAEGDFDGYIMSGLKDTEAGDKDIWTAKLEEVENPEAGEDKFELAWEKTYGVTGEETVGNITTTNDGGYVLTGSMVENGDRNLWAKKLDHDGSEVWSRNYGGSGSDSGNYIEQTADGGYIITGSSSSDDLGSSELQGSDDLLLVRLGENGEVQWSDLLGGSAADQGKSVREYEEGKYIVTGSSASTDGDLESRADNSKLDKESMWSLEYSRAFTEEIFSPEREAEKAAPIGTGKIFLDIAQAQIEFDWEENKVTKISAEAEQRTNARFGVQNGPNASHKTLTRIDNLRMEELGFNDGWLDGDFSDENYINQSLKKLDSAIGKLSSARSEIGAFTNRLEHSLNKTENYKTNLEASNSRIKDIDVAKEMMSQVRHQIIQQASLAMVAQVNQSMQTSLQLFN
ncbi:flagellin-like hook-associated protein FlgL [Halanaerobium saccharolyticum]|uniref:Flagellin n=1 Tax=Halanaerobium saccharolyticum TaxID=43595 RepID=A0A4R6RUD9_9FIRM|nr:flagellin [Halanaerobium saccharolyticum]TDP89666.1 flagellin-like hook-associated protein FlgL [Halanaerobium saccharolyticum]